MKLIIDIPNYNLKEVQNGSIASKVILEAVKNGKPYEETELIDSTPTVEPQKAPIANVTFDTEKLKELTDDIVERIKSGEIVLQDERLKGEWIETQRGIIVTEYKCPFCGRTVKDDTGYDVSADFPFCHCGADMRNEKITVYQTPMEVVEKGQPLSNSDEISKAMEKAKEKRGNKK